MAQSLNITNTLGKVVTLQNPDTNASNITVDIDKLVVKDSAGNVGLGVTPSTNLDIAQSGSTNGSYGYKISQPSVTGNYGFFGIDTTNQKVVIQSSSTYALSFNVNGAEKYKVDSSGNLLLTSGTGALGYGTGAGGTVTQLTSKSTTVTLNKPTGQITMNNAALASGAVTGFTFLNSLLGAYDTLLITSPNINYNVWFSAGSGGGGIYIKNISAGSLSEAVVLNYTIIKGAIA